MCFMVSRHVVSLVVNRSVMRQHVRLMNRCMFMMNWCVVCRHMVLRNQRFMVQSRQVQ